MARPSLLQAIFQQPSQQYVMKEDAYAEPNLKVWRASFPFAHGKDKPVPKHRPLSLDVGQVPELPHEGPPSMTPSPSPTPPLISPASTPKSSTPSFTDETSDSSADAEFETPPDSPKPSVEDIPQHTVAQETLSPPSLLLSAERPGMTSTSSPESSSSANSLFSTRSTDTDATSPQSSPVMSPQSPQSPTKRQVRQTPLSGVPDWAKDVRWLVGHQPAAKRAALSALADPNYRPISQARAATAPARHSSYEPRVADQFGVYVAPPRSSGSRKRRSRAKTEGRRSGYRMSALVEVSEGEEAGEVTAEGIVRKRSTSTQRARPRPHSVRSSSSTSSNRTILPPLQVSETIAGLSLPRTAYTPSRPADRPTNAVDLTKAGLSQSMTSLSVIRGGPSSRMRRISLSLSLNGSASSLSGMSSRNASLSSLGSRSMLGLGSSASIPLAVRLAEIEGALGLTAHMSPSRKVGSSQVLVQVHAVALDALDAIILSKRLAKGGYGFVPGRSFVGRAEECGFEVGNVNRGDWVIGLTEIRKCGALSEYVIIDKSRVCTVPRPTDRLTTTQCALLPLCGVPAHRAVRTIPNSATKTGKDGQQRPMKVLVLQAHDGAGLCAVQVLRQLGMRVTAQVPIGSENVGFGTGPSLGLKARGRTRAGKGREYEPPKSSKRMEEVEVVVGDDPVEVIGRLDEGVYDAVVDTVGGRGVWDACRRVMCKDAHFTTLVGDSTDSIPSINAHVRSSFRSLARAWARKDKGLGYQWVSPAADLDHEGEDVRHSLNAVAEAAARAAYGSPFNSDEDTVEGMLPRVMCSFPFERAQDAFSVDEDGRGPLVYGGTVVVRIL